MDKKWLYLFLLALLVLLIGLLSNSWTVGSINETKESEIQRQEQELKGQQEKLEEQDKKIKQLKQKLESKLLKQQLAKVSPQAPRIPSPQLSNPNSREILSMVYKTFWPDERFSTLIACESGFRPTATGYDASHNQYNYGLFQISQYHGWSANYLMVPQNNIKAAKVIWDRQGPHAWPHCSRVAGFI